jgi:hypothetical protein
MSICETNEIDIVAARSDSSVVKLIIADHLGWADPHEHCLLLQEKLNTYITFVESGQLQQMDNPRIPPDAVVVISVVALHEPSPEGTEFLAQATEFLRGVGMTLEVERRPQRLTYAPAAEQTVPTDVRPGIRVNADPPRPHAAEP